MVGKPGKKEEKSVYLLADPNLSEATLLREFINEALEPINLWVTSIRNKFDVSLLQPGDVVIGNIKDIETISAICAKGGEYWHLKVADLTTGTVDIRSYDVEEINSFFAFGSSSVENI
jgi:putative CRISPR-associated protein (TIGR02620 family)